jgi:hypothetical protein
LIPIKRSVKGLVARWFWEKPLKRSTFPYFNNFWNLHRSRELIGTVAEPVAGRACDTVSEAAAAVKALMAQGRR